MLNAHVTSCLHRNVCVATKSRTFASAATYRSTKPPTRLLTQRLLVHPCSRRSFPCAATKKQGRDRATESGRTKLKPGRPDGTGKQKAKWAVLDWAKYNEPWQVSWGPQRLALGMLGWALSFLLVGVLFVPLLIYLRENQEIDALAKSNQSILVLISQGLETIVGVGIIKYAASRPGDEDDDILKLDLSKPLNAPTGWLFWGLLGIAASPVVVGATAAVCEALSPQGLGGRGTADDVARILSVDVPSFVSLFTVTAVLAPFLEETVFRGFLLPSLTKFMPTYAAVVVTAVAFAACHLSPRDFPQLTALGILLGFSYVRSRNLLTPMLIHGAWNGTVLTFLLLLVSAGYNVSDLLAGKGA
ncbi:hypothetical protein WJX73_001898 [Symbiochloris irregularis]|uniref:CAAX prenyl protease 2/Lysostaphin resistance protein A-like domain-containing protein n=1 Tax=Symbiochloris irregularis TaxID=706552 RepID=A0AAW1P286_9CHLO